MGEDLKATPKNIELEKLVIFKEKNRYEPAESLSVTMENQILLDIRSVIDGGLVTEIFSQNSPISSENFNLETALINNPIEEGLSSSQDNHLCTIAVGETLLDHFKYPLTFENQNTLAKVEIYPHGNSSCDNEDLEKYKELNFLEEAEHLHSPYLPSNGVHFLSSVVMQHKNCNDPSSSISSLEGAVSQNVRMIPEPMVTPAEARQQLRGWQRRKPPIEEMKKIKTSAPPNPLDFPVPLHLEVFRSLIPPVAGENNCICYDQFKEIHSSSVQSQHLPDCLNESSSGVCGIPQTSESIYDEIAEVREAVSNVMENDQDEAIFQSSNVGKSGSKLLALHSLMEEPSCSHRNDSNPVVICQLDGGTQILCINSSGTRELKRVHLIPQYQDRHNYLQSGRDAYIIKSTASPGLIQRLAVMAMAFSMDVGNPVATVLGQFLPVPGKLDLNEKQFENGSLQSVASAATYHSESNLQGPMKMTSVGLPFGSGDTKSKKPCNCTKSLCLKLYCDCFANGDFCNNCNCNNCYNNLLHEPERFKAIKACLDRNPEAFLPKIGKRTLGEIKPRHNKGCNCKRSGCLKNYCECFEAKIMCSSICKCIGCKNYEESPDQKNQLNVPNYMDLGNNEVNSPVFTSAFEMLPKSKTDRQPAVCISWEEVKATCACLLVQAEEAEKGGYSVCLAERMIVEEFGRCLSQILHA